MKKAYKYLIYTIPAITLILLLIIASFFDLQISKTIADLEFGNYYSSNFFGVFFEIIGETPVYFLPAFAFCVFAVTILKKINKKNKKIFILNIISVILIFLISILFNYYAIFKMFEYIKEIYQVDLNYLSYLTQIICALLVTLVNFLMIKDKDTQTLKKLCFLGLIICITSLVTNITTQILKPIFLRVRYRTMLYFNQTDFSSFTNWYQTNKNVFTSLNNYSTDMIKSFPSGHTAASTSTFALISLVYLFPNQQKYKKILQICFPIFYALIVGFSRIVMGAHFLSDVVFSLLLGYTVFVITNFLILKFFSKSKP